MQLTPALDYHTDPVLYPLKNLIHVVCDWEAVCWSNQVFYNLKTFVGEDVKAT